MKNLLLIIILCLSGIISNATSYYVATTGSDSNPGTISLPFRNISKLSTVMVAGDIAYIRGGTYASTAGNAASGHFIVQNLNGTSGSPIKIWAYPGETPMFDCSNITPTYGYPFAFVVSGCNYVHLKGLTIKNLKQIADGTGVSRGFAFQNSNNCTAELLNVFNIGGTGCTIINSNNPYFLNCDSHNNGDGVSPDTWNFGDGFTCTGGDPSTDIVFEGCRTWMNGDDGWDFFAWSGSKVTIKNCWSFWNSIKPWGISGTQPSEAGMTPEDATLWAGNTAFRTSTTSGEGFKLGGFNVGGPGPVGMPTTLKKYLDHCVSFENSGTGYAANMDAQYSHQMQLLNCISYHNGNDGFGFGTGRSVGIAMIFKNCVAANNNQLQSGADWVYDGLPANISNNIWMSTYGGINYGNLYPSIQATSADFLSVSSAGVTGPRQSDGSLPVLNFLKLASTSDLIDAGINVGLPYISTAPDLGAFEYNGSSSNLSPTANAGPDITITLPTNSVSLIGSGTDPDGTISAYLWTKLSGPAGGTITTSTAATTSVTGLVQGVYQFQLKVTDNKAATSIDAVQVIVNAPVSNIPPTANAGADKTIILPTSSVSLTGTGTDPDGSISAYLWTKISGPTGGTITTSTTATTTVTALGQGIYKFELKVIDNAGAAGKDTMQVTVNATGNLVPTANAGSDQSIVLPTSTVSLSGSATDADGTIASYAWSKVSGPASYMITASTAAATTVTALAQGVYQFELKVTDNVGAIASDTMQVTVNPAPSGGASSAYGGISWPIPGTIQAEDFDIGGQNVDYYDNTNGNNGGAYRKLESVDITTASEGGYLVGWIVAGEWMKYSVNVTGTGAYSILARIASTSTGSMRVEMDGVVIATILIPNTGGSQTWQTVTVPNISLTAGNKVMRIYAVSSGFNINYLTFITTGTNASPRANAGADQTITLPTSTVSLSGTGTDADGTIAAYSWVKVSGPSTGIITTPTAAATTVTALTQGIYRFELTVTDNAGATGKDTLQVIVNAAVTANNAYGGVRWPIPGTIEAENFDLGGQNVAYLDNTKGNNGGLYRTSDYVDITTSSEGGYLVGWITAGEWMKYSVNVTSDGIYTITARVACSTTGKSFNIEMDGSTIATVIVPNTGGSQTWQTVTIPNISLTAGDKTMRIFASNAGGFNINYITFTATAGMGLRSNNADSTNVVDKNTTVTTFPLPFSTSFKVSLYGQTKGSYDLNLVDLSGKTVWKKTVNKSGETAIENIYMGNLPDGIYILQVVSPDQKRSTHKLIKN